MSDKQFSKPRQLNDEVYMKKFICPNSDKWS